MSNEYKVGYGKPPKHTQFKKGQSGNKSGKAKGTKNFKTDFLEEMATMVSLNEGGKQIKVTKQRAIIKRMINSAISDSKHSEKVIKLSLSFSETNKALEGEDLSPEELTLLELFIQEKKNERD